MIRETTFGNEGSPAADQALFYVKHLARQEETEMLRFARRTLLAVP